MDQPAELKKKFDRIHSRIKNACTAADRDHAPALLAASKGHSHDSIRAIAGFGQKRFGENYAQELIEKSEALKDLDIHWEFMGRLQSNKIRKIVQYACCIQSVDSIKHARAIERHALDLNKTPFPIYVAVNLGDEPQKTGVPTNKAAEFVRQIQSDCPGLRVLGLMSVPPKDLETQESLIPLPYRQIATLKEELGLPELSLGMSGDLELAIAVGSTCVRIGTDLFGPRPAPR